MSNKAKPEYMLFFSGNWDRGLAPDELQEVMDHVMEWFERLNREGKVKGGEVLGDRRTIVTADKHSAVMDGPYPEAKEGIGGYLLLKAASFEEAVAVAETCPTLEYGVSIEIRPIMEECPVLERVRQLLPQSAK